MGIEVRNLGNGIFHVKPEGGKIKDIIIHFRCQGIQCRIFAGIGEIVKCSPENLEESLDKILEILFFGEPVDSEPGELNDPSPFLSDFLP